MTQWIRNGAAKWCNTCSRYHDKRVACALKPTAHDTFAHEDNVADLERRAVERAR